MYLLNLWSRVLLEKLTGLQPVKKLLAFYGTRRFITAFTGVPILSHIDPVHVLTSHILKIHFNIILPSTPGSSRWSPSLIFPVKTLYTPLLHTCYVPRPSHSSQIDHPNNIWWMVRIIKLLLIFTAYTRTHLPADSCKRHSSCFKLDWTVIYLMELWNAVTT